MSVPAPIVDVATTAFAFAVASLGPGVVWMAVWLAAR